MFVCNSINRLVRVTIQDTHLLKLSVKVSNGLSTCSILIKLSTIYFNLNFLNINNDSYTWFQATTVWFLSLTFSKNFMQARESFVHFSLISGKLMIANIFLFTYLLNKIVLNFKVFKLMAFLNGFFRFLFYLRNVDFIYTSTILYINLKFLTFKIILYADFIC